MKSSGLFWSLVREASVQGGSVLTLLALAIFLPPREFGIVAIAAVWLNLLVIFSDLGFAAAVIQRRVLDESHLTSAFVLNVVLGLLLCALGWVVSVAMAGLESASELAGIMPFLACSVIFTTISVVPQALARKQLQFKALALRDGSAVLVSGVVAIALAHAGFGIWAFVAQVLVRTLLGSLLVWFVVHWRPRLSEFRWNAVRDLWGFSSAVIVYSMLKWAQQSLDKFLLAFLFGTIQLGYYAFGERSIVAPTTSVRTAAGAYFFPVYSAAQDQPQTLAGHYLHSIRLLVFFLFPATTLYILVAPTLIPLVFGDKWTQAIPISQIFAGVVFAQVLMSPAGELMKARNKPRWLIYWTLALFMCQAAAMIAGSPLGLKGVVAAIVVVNFLFVGVVVRITFRLIPVGLSDLLRAVRPGASLSAGLLAIWLVMHNLGADPVATLLVLTLLAVAAGIVLLSTANPSLLRGVPRSSSARDSAPDPPRQDRGAHGAVADRDEY